LDGSNSLRNIYQFNIKRDLKLVYKQYNLADENNFSQQKYKTTSNKLAKNVCKKSANFLQYKIRGKVCRVKQRGNSP